jgi:alpha-galactosidase
LNRGIDSISIRFNWKEHSQSDSFLKREIDFNQITYRIRDLWAHQDLGTTGTEFGVELSSHDVIFLKLLLKD